MLLDRDTFRNSVFKRDGNACVVCGGDAKDAHHIIERRLFDNGGYFLDNGVALCGYCHIKAEQTIFTPEYLRERAKISKVILPEHLYEDYEYTKWGDIQNSNGTRYKGELFFEESVQKILKSANALDLYSERVKYPRTYHLPFSPGTTDDDKVIKDLNTLLSKPIVVTVKMDGENTTGYSDGYIHARSLDSQNHASRNWVKKFLSERLYELPKGYRLCGENLYAKHSIHYKDLESYFYLFSIWDERNNCLSWQDTQEWAELLELKLVPTLFEGIGTEEILKQLYVSKIGENDCEGFVARWNSIFSYADFRRGVAKYVRLGHVASGTHWIKRAIIPNALTKN